MNKFGKGWPLFFIWAFAMSVGLNVGLLTNIDSSDAGRNWHSVYHLCFWYIFGAFIGHVGAKTKSFSRYYRIWHYRQYVARQKSQEFQFQAGPYRGKYSRGPHDDT